MAHMDCGAWAPLRLLGNCGNGEDHSHEKSAFFVGPQRCAQCHPDKARTQSKTAMARALRPAAESEILRANPKLTYRETGFIHEISRGEAHVLYTISSGRDRVSIPIAWSFGSGDDGQTYVFERKGVMYESRVTSFAATGTLDITPGMRGVTLTALMAAAGVPLKREAARKCFGCHSSQALEGSQIDLDKIVPGVTCENCHGPGSAHIAAITAGTRSPIGMQKLGRLNAEQISNLCGTCHRTWEEVVQGGIRGLDTLRFHPYRLTNSRCYSATNKRISCVACHDRMKMWRGRRVSMTRCVSNAMRLYNTFAPARAQFPSRTALLVICRNWNFLICTRNSLTIRYGLSEPENSFRTDPRMANYSEQVGEPGIMAASDERTRMRS